MLGAQVLATQLPPELETYGIFIKLTEEARRYRGLQLDMGEEGAKINIQQGYKGHDILVEKCTGSLPTGESFKSPPGHHMLLQ